MLRFVCSSSHLRFCRLLPQTPNVKLRDERVEYVMCHSRSLSQEDLGATKTGDRCHFCWMVTKNNWPPASAGSAPSREELCGSTMQAAKFREGGTERQGRDGRKCDLAMSLIEAATNMAEEHVLTFLDWQPFTSLSPKSTGTRKGKVWRLDSSVTVREVIEPSWEVLDRSTDLMLRLALQRRGVALEMAGVMAYESHEFITSSWTSTSRIQKGQRWNCYAGRTGRFGDNWPRRLERASNGRLTVVVLVTCTSRPPSPATKCRFFQQSSQTREAGSSNNVRAW